ncbi:hypothetical protein EVAR_49268_1 [Eumeta japonica]|uniref:Uncharacterized protein n=1 Tax=Eumeta variegata TaxID=151549 RepID=A0A4C1YG15_EUMVA|nr:hypothetical protein EVAR_49268_1 [Eumeta japonica]
MTLLRNRVDFVNDAADFSGIRKEIDALEAERLGRSCLSIVPRSRSHARLRRNAIMSHAFSCVQPAFTDL